MNEDDELGKIMTRNPLSVKLTNTVASCAHMMIWEGIELLPVTNNNKSCRCHQQTRCVEINATFRKTTTNR